MTRIRARYAWQMGASTYVGRVGGLAVAFGLGTAVILGGGCGIAAADETGPDGGSSASSVPASSTGAAKDANPAKRPTATDGTDTSSTAGGSTSSPTEHPAKTAKPTTSDGQGSSNGSRDDAEGAEADPSRDGVANPAEGTPDESSDGAAGFGDSEPKTSKSEHVSAAPKISAERDAYQRSAPPTTSPGSLDAGDTAAKNDAERGVAKPQTSDDTIVATLATAEPTAADPAVVAPAAPASAPTNVVEVFATAVSTFVGSLLTPLAAGTTPETPATQPQLWTLLAFARRELETAFAPPSSAQGRVGDVTVGEALTGAAPEAAQAQLAAAAQVTPVANSLTYTAPPNTIDQFTVLGLRVLRVVSSVIGVDLFAQINKLLITNSPPFFLTFGLNTHQTEVELTDGTTWKVWEFQPPNPTDKTVIAIHGSGFIYEPNLMQWYDYTSMARDTGATVVVPLYPLATTEAGSALNVVPDMADFISSQIEQHGADDVSVYGDSAGSIIAIAAVRQLVIAGSLVPSSMVLLSLTPDGSLSNPDIENTDDPVVDVDNLGDYATSHWGDGLDDPGTDPRYNALSFETLVGLPPTTIYVGSTEFVLPDTLLLYQKAVEEGAPISVVVGQGQIHDWALGGLPINSAAPGVRRDVYRQLGLV